MIDAARVLQHELLPEWRALGLLVITRNGLAREEAERQARDFRTRNGWN